MLLRPRHFIPPNTKIDFVSLRWWAFSVTIVLMIITVGALTVKGLNLGIDFKGGILIEAKSSKVIDVGALRTELGALNLGEIELQEFGSPNDVLVRIQRQEGDEAAQQRAIQLVRE